MKLSRALCGCACIVALFLAAGCAWQQIPPAAYYAEVESIPLDVGIVLAGDSGSVLNGQRVVKLLGDWKVFQSVDYPRKSDSDVDAALTISVDSTWAAPEVENRRRAFVVGLSLGALSPFIGQSVLHFHHMEATIKAGDREIAKYAIDTGGEVSFGFGADEVTVLRKTLESDMSWLAHDLAEAIRTDWPGISTEIGQ